MKSKIRNYEIQSKLGSGSYGVIYKVVNKNDNNIYVLKQIQLSKLGNTAKKNAINEATILGKLNHPFIVKYIDSFTQDKTLNIVMEYCDGGDLNLFLKQQAKKPLRQEKIWKIFLQITIGLDHIHQRKILHRDIKTLNIFLHKDSVKIGDLGVAKMLQEHDFAQTMVGTPFYLSPQLCQQKPYNQKSDIWALGCLLYELCTYRHPFEAANQASLILKIIRGKYSPIPQFYSTDLKQLIDSCLDRDYKRRPTANMILAKPKSKQFIVHYKLTQFPKPEQKKVVERVIAQKKQIIAQKKKQQPKLVEQLKKPIISTPSQQQKVINKKPEFPPPPPKQKIQQIQKVIERAEKKIQSKSDFINNLQKALEQQKKIIQQKVFQQKVLQQKLIQQKAIQQKVQHKIQRKVQSKVEPSKKKSSIYYEIKNQKQQKSPERRSQRIPSKGSKNQIKNQNNHINNIQYHPPSTQRQAMMPPLPPKDIKNKQEIIKVKVEKPIQSKVFESQKNINKSSKPIIKSGGFANQEPQMVFKPKSKQAKQVSETVGLGRKNSVFQVPRQQKNDEKHKSEKDLKKNIGATVSIGRGQQRYAKPNERGASSRVRKGAKNQLARNAQNVSKKLHEVTREEHEQVLNLPDIVKKNSLSQSPDQKQIMKKTFRLDQIDDNLVLKKYEQMLEQQRQSENLKESNAQYSQSIQKHEEQIEQQPLQIQRNSKQEQNIEQELILNDNQEEEMQNQHDDQIYEVNKFSLTQKKKNQANIKNQQQEQLQQRTAENQDRQWSFDEQPELPFLQETQTPIFQEVNPYLIEQKSEQETVQNKKIYLQIKLQQNLKRQDQINQLMQMKINECKSIVPKHFESILDFFRKKINMEQEYTQQDERQVESFLKMKGLTDHRKFQNIYKIMHFQMELDNTRKIIQRICKRLNELQVDNN